MGLPNIGPLELIIILAIALLIVGPGRLPEMGSAIGRTIKEFRSASSDITDAAKVETKEAAPSPVQPNTLSTEAAPSATSAPAVAAEDGAPVAAPAAAASEPAPAAAPAPAEAPAPAAVASAQASPPEAATAPGATVAADDAKKADSAEQA